MNQKVVGTFLFLSGGSKKTEILILRFLQSENAEILYPACDLTRFMMRIYRIDGAK